ncbi:MULTISPECIES: HIT family protein [Rhizobium/Agrobacterium group]|uniref:HIT family protein n=2 Tax=Neorhizobium TaxID=1525371 RepID=A0ABV0M9E1_9HYPH|nr:MULTISPECIES: HIT family protein [Rhizobium/Agrobacterium group]KGD98189.1 diadenosine tetraphosphate hydrolase [Rhizobium sp. YS-1r]MCC2613201.1 HIT family protein [Neorhizobium petrolearium]WGI71343.1 HIT family protein [Neorhizobium petrolearium]
MKNKREESLSDFELDGRLARDSDLVTVLGLCQLRILKDSRWPWLMLVPQRNGMVEIFDLTPLDQALLAFETNTVAAALKEATGATKVNVGALGNIVRQLHVHVIARFEGDPNWPGPVWGFGQAVPYDEPQKQDFLKKLIEAL